MNSGMQALRPPQDQQGETLVGLLVGMGLGLVVLAGGTHLLTQHLTAHRWALQDSHVHHDLRSALDSMARELRQAQGVGMAWSTRASAQCMDAFCRASADVQISHQRIDFSRDRNQNGVLDNNECAGFRLREHKLQVRTACQPEVWTDLTDAGSLKMVDLQWRVSCEQKGRWVSRRITVQSTAEWPRDASRGLSLSQSTALRNDVPAQPWPGICGAAP